MVIFSRKLAAFARRRLFQPLRATGVCLPLILSAGLFTLSAPSVGAQPKDGDVPAVIAEPEGGNPASGLGEAAEEDYSSRQEVRLFIEEMVQKHGFDRDALVSLFRHAKRESKVLAAIQPVPGGQGRRSWVAYRRNFVEQRHIQRGVRFWEENKATLEAASARFGVPPEIMVAIIGIETFYGRVQGRFSTLSALTTLAFDYPPRADLFRRELEAFLLLARENGESPLNYTGSYAGALGQPQFLPSSVRHYAVDFDGDGKIDLAHNSADAIGSVGSFLSMHGWQAGGLVAVPARISGDAYAALVDGRVVPQFSMEDLRTHGIEPSGMHEGDKTALVDLNSARLPTEYWLGFQNFYVITRYNRSSFYAMAVFQLAEKLRQALNAPPPVISKKPIPVKKPPSPHKETRSAHKHRAVQHRR